MLPSSQPTLAHSHRLGLPIARTGTGTLGHHPGLATLEELGATVTIRKDAEIHAQGDRALYCYRIVSGCVRSVKLMEDGRRQIDEFLLPGDWFGFEALDTHDFAAEAVTEAVLRRYPRRAVDALAAEDVGVAGWLLRLASGHLRSARDRMVALGRKTASERLAGFLLELTRRMPHDRTGAVALPMSRGDIADHLGLTIETVCRALAQMRRDGTIGLTRTRLAVPHPTALEAMSSATRH